MIILILYHILIILLLYHDKIWYDMIWYHMICRYNGSLGNGDRGRKRSKFSLYRRSEANGVKPSQKHVVTNPKESKVSWSMCPVRPYQGSGYGSWFSGLPEGIGFSPSSSWYYSQEKKTQKLHLGRSESETNLIDKNTVTGAWLVVSIRPRPPATRPSLSHPAAHRPPAAFLSPAARQPPAPH